MSCLSKETSLLNASVFAMETKQDPVLCKVLQYYIPRRVGQITLTQYFNFTTAEGHEVRSLMKRVSSHGIHASLSQSNYRAFLLADLHTENLGMVKMKQLTRGYFWRPGLNKQTL